EGGDVDVLVALDALLLHELLDERLALAVADGVALRALVGDVHREAVEGLERREVELLGALEARRLLETLTDPGDGGRDAVELEVAIVPRALAVVVLGELAGREREVGLAVRVADGLLVLARTLGEEIGRPLVAEIEDEVAVLLGLGALDLADDLAVLVIGDGPLERDGGIFDAGLERRLLLGRHDVVGRLALGGTHVRLSLRRLASSARCDRKTEDERGDESKP